MWSFIENIKSSLSVRSKSPLFRRVIVPWYDTEPVCYFTLVFSVGVILFSLAGIFEANSTPSFKPYIWVPSLLLIMSIVVFISTLMRLIRRKYGL
jgi:hypothetical protein